MTMIASTGFSQNVLRTPSGRDAWSAGLAIASSMCDDDAVVVGTHSNIPKFRRSPHKLPLDENRIVYSFCDLHTIPEDEPVCEYRQVLLDKRLEREAFGSGSFSTSSSSFSSDEVSTTSSSDTIISTVSTDDEGLSGAAESEVNTGGNTSYDALCSQQFHAALFQALRNERLERERQPNVDTEALSSDPILVVDERKGKQRHHRALNSEQFQAILVQVVRDESSEHEEKQSDGKRDTPEE